MSIAGKNLRFLRKQKGFTQEEFAQQLQIKRSLLGAYEEERAEPRIEVLEIVSEMFGLSLDELLRQELSGEPTSNKRSFLEQRRALKMAAPVQQIHMVPVKAAAGYLAGYADPAFIDELNTFTLPMLSAGYYRAFEIVGDSMLPTPSGSVIVGEKIERLDDVKPNQTYIVVSQKEGIVYKRVVPNKDDQHQLTLVSDNPDYQPYQMPKDEVIELWQASMIISKANTQHRWDVNQLASMVSELHQQVHQLQQRVN